MRSTDGIAFDGAEAAYRGIRGETPVVALRVAPEHVAAFIAGYGWREIEQMGSQEFTAR